MGWNDYNDKIPVLPVLIVQVVIATQHRKKVTNGCRVIQRCISHVSVISPHVAMIPSCLHLFIFYAFYKLVIAILSIDRKMYYFYSMFISKGQLSLMVTRMVGQGHGIGGLRVVDTLLLSDSQSRLKRQKMIDRDVLSYPSCCSCRL